MTISSSVAKSGPYNGNGATTSFSYGFKIIAESHIEVILTDADAVETVQTITTDYTVTGVGDANGGSVVMVTAPATGELLTLKLNVPLTQEVDLENQGAFFAETIEAAFDKVTQIVVQQQEVIDRCVQVDISSGDDPADFLDSIDAAVSAASASASSASTSAGTATTQAGIATTQAGLAAAAKTAAETAETNAETAQAAAEAARDLAQGYATAADVAKIEWQGAWLTATSYAVNDAVSNGGSSYICIVAHTSGTFATDLAALRWEVLAAKGTDGAGSGDLLAANNLSDLASAATARTNLGLGTVATLASDTDTTLAANSDSNVATQKAVKAYVAAQVVGGVAGSIRNAKMSITSASASGTFTADQIIVYTALNGSPKLLSSYSQAINLATTGAGAMDTGTAPVSGFVSLYAIAKADGTTSILACSSATSTATIYGGANMPSGYTYSALIGMWPTNASSQFKQGIQRDRQWAGLNLSVLSTSSPATSATSLSISSAIPPNATTVQGLLQENTAGGYLNVQSDAGGTSNQAITGVAAGMTVWFDLPVITAQTIYYYASSGNSVGILVNGYTF